MLWGALSSAATPPDLKLFCANYTAIIEGLPITVKMTRKLKKIGDDRFQFTSSATSAIASVKEESEFSLNGNQLIPIRYGYQRAGLIGKKDSFVEFDFEKNLYQHNKGTSTLIEKTLDMLSYQYQLKLDLKILSVSGEPLKHLVYQVADTEKIKEYRFKALGEEIIKTPLGRILTLKIERIKKNDSERSTTLWLAKNHDYLLTKLQQSNDGKKFELNLESFTFTE